MTQTIDITPNWATAIEILIAALEDGTEQGKAAAREELRRVARMLDAQNEGAQL